MRVCDRCKSVKAKCFDIRVRVFKEDEERQIIEIPYDLCNNCLTYLNTDLGKMKLKVEGQLTQEIGVEVDVKGVK